MKHSETPVGGLPQRQGLYDPAQEHDACGVGLIANLEGEKSHDVVSKALQILVNLAHRGACRLLAVVMSDREEPVSHVRGRHGPRRQRSR